MTRIVAGTYRGRTLATPRGDRTRPTSDRVREAVFATMAVWAGNGGDLDAAVAGLSFLDLFAGTGAMGYEAASRGAARVTLVEKDETTRRVIIDNGRSLGCPADVKSETAERFCARAEADSYDIVWLDPPYVYATSQLNDLLVTMVGNGVVVPDGLIAVERETRSAPPTFPAGYAKVAPRRYGETTVYFAEGEAE